MTANPIEATRFGLYFNKTIVVIKLGLIVEIKNTIVYHNSFARPRCAFNFNF